MHAERLSQVRAAMDAGDLATALRLLLSAAPLSLRHEAVLLVGRYSRLAELRTRGELTLDAALVEENRIARAVSGFVDSLEHTGTFSSPPPVVALPAASARGSLRRVFLSYSHDDTSHTSAVRTLADRLRLAGLDAWVDAYEPYPKQGWPRWMEEQLAAARFVIIVVTQRYRQRFEDPGGIGGVMWESILGRNALYATGGRNTDAREFVPVWFELGGERHVPSVLAHLPGHALTSEVEFRLLEHRLLGIQGPSVPPIGGGRVP